MGSWRKGLIYVADLSLLVTAVVLWIAWILTELHWNAESRMAFFIRSIPNSKMLTDLKVVWTGLASANTSGTGLIVSILAE
ncbi:hypothetical protein CVT26_009868 [Gymnopilus dilepis]|uniref:Uncharacterized protein n=1 Tax=Gymnopilus dilepis TaxID=231916 RepID=A0A409YC81_9AGAR|nr:hypothetical protein CVT26_009868 [Gymnopilus dilepis]